MLKSRSQLNSISNSYKEMIQSIIVSILKKINFQFSDLLLGCIINIVKIDKYSKRF